MSGCATGIADVSRLDNASKNFGLMGLGMGAGAAIGPLVYVGMLA
jgi:hypothetical protein